MKKIILLLSTLFSFSFFLTAQSIDKALEHLENVRLQNGEQSQEYLSALDTVILKANITGAKTTAFAYRKQHLDIVKQMKGERCVEVADDLWRLGNTSCMLGDTVAGLDYYSQAAEVFEKSINFKKNYDYIQHYDACLYHILQILVSKKDQEGVSYYSTMFDKLSEETKGANSCSHLDDLIAASQFNYLVGNLDNALNYCILLTNNCKEIDSCNYRCVHVAYEFIESCYSNTDRNDKQIAIAKDHLNKLDSAKIPLDKEIIETLYYLLAVENSIDDAILYGKRAEKMLIDKYSSNEELYNDQLYYEIVNLLALKHFINVDYISGITYYQIACNVLEHNNMIDSKEYYDALKYLVHCAYNAGEYAFVIKSAPKMESMIFTYSATPSKDAFYYVCDMAVAYSKSGDYKKADKYYDEALGLSPQMANGDELKETTIDILIAKADNYILEGLKQDAIASLNQAKRIVFELPESSKPLNLVKMLSLEGQIIPDYEEAMAKFDSALYILEHQIDSIKPIIHTSDHTNAETIYNTSWLKTLQKEYAFTTLNKGLVSYNNGQNQVAYISFLEASSLIEQLTSMTSVDYLTCQNNIALCQMKMGMFSDAINTLDNNLETIKNTYGINHPLYLSCLQNISVYYSSIGNHEKGLDYCREAVISSKTIYGEDSEQHAQSLMNLGALFLSLGNYSEAYLYLKEAQSYFEKTISATPVAMCLLYQNLSNVLMGLGQKEEGAKYFNMAKEMMETTWGKHSVEYAELVASYGWMLDDSEEVFDCFLEASSIFLTLGCTYHPSCIRSLICYGLAGITLLEKPLASDYIQITTEAVKDYYRNNLSYYIGDDRSFVWQYLFGVKNTVFSARTDNFSDLYLFNYILFSKSLMLSTSDSFKKAILATGQQHLIDQFNDIQALQRAIDNQSFSLSVENQPLEQLYDRKNSMERKLMAEMKSLGYSINDSITYNDIRKSLKDNEIAIEFVDYYHLREKKIYYLALLAKSSWENPIYVLLCTEDELKNRIGNPNVTYSTDDLYRLLWQPLLEYVGDSCKVYFSPSGMLHTIALESVYTPEGSCLSDKYNLVRLTSTRELCKAKQPKTYETGAIYGGLQYDVEQQRMAEVAAMNKTELEESPAFALRGDDRGNWNYLPGTLAEAEHIASIMSQANIGCGLYEGDMGSEESFKALSGGNTDIIHLATHGYFIEGEKADMNDFMNSLSPLAKQKTDSVIDPLLRSGLILSGGNNAWLGKELPEGIEDGVLTALEISTMNLSGTDMVVMSACETGLGDITGDGVFGLQRAFKMAGVQTLVMSLWKVDDNATSLMMQTFYEHLLSGITKREAFRLAQAAVRAKYPEPYYWAGFIMLD